jgi:hypothetical protein
MTFWNNIGPGGTKVDYLKKGKVNYCLVIYVSMNVS